MLSSSVRSASPPTAEPVPLNAPLFRRLVESLSEERRSVILDLGLVRPSLVNLLTPFRCRLDIADIAGDLAGLDAETDPLLLPEKAENLLPAPRNEPVDIVLCWDFLNYLKGPALGALMDRIAARMRPGAFAHALIVYSATRMPELPNGYAPLPDGRLIETISGGAQRNAPRYSSDDLRRYLRPYTSESVMLLKNGMQEYLFRAQAR